MRRPVALGLLLVAPAAVFPACASLVPLREPPLLESADPTTAVTTRAEALARFGPPHAVRVSDLGEVLVYRRVVVVDGNPNRYHGQDRGARAERHERLLLYLDAEGRVVRWATELE